MGEAKKGDEKQQDGRDEAPDSLVPPVPCRISQSRVFKRAAAVFSALAWVW
jgi:hypothetical protein